MTQTPLIFKIAIFLFCLLVPWTGSRASTELERYDASRQTIVLPNGERLAFIDRGPRDGTPVVLIHGYTDSARDWFPLVPALPAHYRLIIPDLRGHGASSKPDCCYTLVDFAYDIKLLLDHLGIARADIVGHSLGSLVTQSLAENWPDRVHRVVLISSSGGLKACPSDKERQERGSAMDFRTPILQLHDPIDPNSPFMKMWWSSPTPVDAEFLRRQRVDSAHMPARVWLAVLDQGLSGLDLQAGLPRLKAPTLLIWGEKDPIMTPEMRGTLVAGLPSAQVVTFAGLGHNAFWEKPANVASTIASFLSHTL
ncbi:putative hydrolase [Ameyamaea chiangmaiensis NBRC 103196]|uniref:Alpha/beta hydrolase n=1 Tax=Ameyamaea chiangmaiensis TaxID=442969 RepID=A0A850PD02_9PROT|nr:alpha/beta hydrolase [Ameyamaea chiangmaiensis]MBS4076057.1 alpha/beta hydrolase [Ameyamaea chiangmaiensis]NVN39832.1 alpha/beta hydrolase [Ameyamaea chiangmaiensis]GBQ66857.1 putative hydrolase [Ameyamaea chiangmaiensis NBRC 103196]